MSLNLDPTLGLPVVYLVDDEDVVREERGQDLLDGVRRKLTVEPDSGDLRAERRVGGASELHGLAAG